MTSWGGGSLIFLGKSIVSYVNPACTVKSNISDVNFRTVIFGHFKHPKILMSEIFVARNI